MLEYYPGITDPNYLRNSINIGPNERTVINDANLSSNLSRAFFPHVPETGPPVHISRDDFSHVLQPDYTFTIYPGHGKMPRTFELHHGSSCLRFHRWSNRFRPGLKIRFTVAFLSGRRFDQFISASRTVPFLISPFPPSPPSLSYSTLFLFKFIRVHVVVRALKRDAFRVATRRISHVSIAQRFTVLSASFPRDFYTACTTTPRPSFPSIRPIHPLLARFAFPLLALAHTS